MCLDSLILTRFHSKTFWYVHTPTNRKRKISRTAIRVSAIIGSRVLLKKFKVFLQLSIFATNATCRHDPTIFAIFGTVFLFLVIHVCLQFLTGPTLKTSCSARNMIIYLFDASVVPGILDKEILLRFGSRTAMERL